MKLGTESRNKTIGAVALLAFAIFLLWRSFFVGPAVQSAPPPPAQTGPAVSTATPARPARDRRRGSQAATPSVADNPLDPRLRLDLLKASQDVEYSGSGRNIFLAQAEPPIPQSLGNGLKKQDEAKVNPQPLPPVTPPQPVIPFKAFGMATGPGLRKVMLVQGEEVFVASEGQVVDRHYRIVKINANSVEVEDLLNNNRQTIPLSAG